MAKICVFGAGAIGGLLAARLANSGLDCLVVARGPVLRALESGSARVIDGPEQFEQRLSVIPPEATREQPAQDILFLTLKAYHLADSLDALAPLVGDQTIVVPLQNGIPWWYCMGQPLPLTDCHLECIDPHGRIASVLPWRQVVGCAVYMSATQARPGLYKNIGPRTLILGSADPERQSLSQATKQPLDHAGFQIKLSGDVRLAIWEKLWGNVFVNPISFLTGQFMDELLRDPSLRSLGRRMVKEVIQVAHSCGAPLRANVQERWKAWGSITNFKTSMLQDLENGRLIELDAILGAVCEIGRMTATPTPTLDQIYTQARSKATKLNCYIPAN